MTLEHPKQNLKIIKNLLVKHMRKTPPKVTDPIAFGAVPSNHMLVSDFIAQKGGWQTPEIKPFEPFTVRPDALVFHYGQTIFEGLKAFKSAKNDQDVFVFRPDMNAKRMALSAKRLAMEPFPEDLFIQCIKELVHVEKDWVLPTPCSLYIRPSMIPLDEGVSYRASKNYRFFIFLSPAKDYFQSGQSIGVYLERQLSRAALGGCGEAKCGGNYAAALLPMSIAKKAGTEQILWLDAQKHEFVEEAGAMNVMFVYGNKVVTPELSGSILHGVTRDSVIKICKDMGLDIEETRISINDLLEDMRQKKVTEAFACGTAASITPINSIVDGTEKVVIGDGKFPISESIKQYLLGIQTGLVKDTHNWLLKI